MAVHVCYNSWDISWQSSAKLQREMTKFCVVYNNALFTLTTKGHIYMVSDKLQ